MSGVEPLRIIHCVRSPVGGIFRHIGDLAVAQHQSGHAVGLILDSSTGGNFEDAHIDRLQPYLALGCKRVPMQRQISPADFKVLRSIYRDIRDLEPDVLHAHGAKGGAYARLIGTAMRWGGSSVKRIYCPHGGSLHHDARSLKGKVYFALERLLEQMTDGLVFVSDYEKAGYAQKVGRPSIPSHLVYNGLRPEEYDPVTPHADARDFLFIGMLRDLKGPDVFIRALAQLKATTGQAPTAHIVGDGPDKPTYQAMIDEFDLTKTVTFHDPMPAREAFAMAHTVVVPSRAESMPYIVLETMAAARPIIATRVGGIPEIFAGDTDRLVAPGDVAALSAAMAEHLDDPAGHQQMANDWRDKIRSRFSQQAMASAIEGFYWQLIERGSPAKSGSPSSDTVNLPGRQPAAGMK